MADRFELQAQRGRLISERNEKIAAIKLEYESKIELINREIEKVPTVRKLTALERHTEPADAPQRFCLECKEPLLRATPENFTRMMDASPELRANHSREDVRYTDLRYMQKPYCCHWCKTHPGEGSHSVWCSSELTQQRREEEEKEEEEKEA